MWFESTSRSGHAGHGRAALPPFSARTFPVRRGACSTATDRLRAHPGLRFVWRRGTHKLRSACVCASRSRSASSTWTPHLRHLGNRWDRTRHPASHAWMTAAVPRLAAGPGAEGVPRVPCRRDGRGVRPAGRWFRAPSPTLVDGGLRRLLAGVVVGACRLRRSPASPCRGRFAGILDRRAARLRRARAVPSGALPRVCDTTLTEHHGSVRGQAGVAVIERAPGTPLDVTAGGVATGGSGSAEPPGLHGSAWSGAAREITSIPPNPHPWARSFPGGPDGDLLDPPTRGSSGRTAVATQESISLRAEGRERGGHSAAGGFASTPPPRSGGTSTLQRTSTVHDPSALRARSPPGPPAAGRDLPLLKTALLATAEAPRAPLRDKAARSASTVPAVPSTQP